MAEVLTEMENFIECEVLLKEMFDKANNTPFFFQNDTYFAYGEFYRYEKKNLSEAIRYYKLCLEERNKIYVLEKNYNVQVADCLYGLGMASVSIGNCREALSYLNKCLNIRLKIFPVRHPDVARSYYGLGIVHYSKNRRIESRQILEKALDIQMEILGEHHKHTIETIKCIDNCNLIVVSAHNNDKCTCF
jgi:tetratricopeptide (TPR) repeat protein